MPDSDLPRTTDEAARAMNATATAGAVDPVAQLHDRVERDFRYHAPRPDQLPKYELLRDTARHLAHVMVDLVPPSRELSRALSSLEDAVMQANSGIARHDRAILELERLERL